jgi:hypothetical protein
MPSKRPPKPSNTHRHPKAITQPAVNYSHMTRWDLKFNAYESSRVWLDPALAGSPWSWAYPIDGKPYAIEPANKFGERDAEDQRIVSQVPWITMSAPTPGLVQRYAPGGMDGQVHQGKSVGTEMRTLPFRKFVNAVL